MVSKKKLGITQMDSTISFTYQAFHSTVLEESTIVAQA